MAGCRARRVDLMAEPSLGRRLRVSRSALRLLKRRKKSKRRRDGARRQNRATGSDGKSGHRTNGNSKLPRLVLDAELLKDDDIAILERRLIESNAVTSLPK